MIFNSGPDSGKSCFGPDSGIELIRTRIPDLITVKRIPDSDYSESESGKL